MVYVFAGTSITIADNAAKNAKQTLNLPVKAFSYLRSHGSLDIEYVNVFEGLMEKITDKYEQDFIVESAKKFFHL